MALIAQNTLLILILMSLLWAYAQRIKDNSIVDVFWGLGFVCIAWYSWLKTPEFEGQSLLVAVLTTVWGIRLAVHIWSRNKGQGEDFRYRAMRKSWGDKARIQALFKVFYFQAVLMIIVSLPIQMIAIAPPSKLIALDYVGLLIWAIGFSYEAISDWQLSRFKAEPNNKGKILMTGLWATSRHPNYFGEIVLWWGIFLIAFQVDYWYISLIGTLTITFLIMRVSGVPLLEKRYADDPEYRAYADATPALFPKLF